MNISKFEENVVNFSRLEKGLSPSGWTSTQTGDGRAIWSVEEDADLKRCILKQSGKAKFPVCILDTVELVDGYVEVKFKAISGVGDQAGGLIWRVKDCNNYYVARANALEDNVTIYHTVQGKRTEKKRTKVAVEKNAWHTLRVDFHGQHFTVHFDGLQVIDWDDNTFTNAGRIGIWTKADSVTLFDDFSFGR